MKNSFKFAAIAAVTAMLAVSCDDDSTTPQPKDDTYTVVTETTLSGITFNSASASSAAPAWVSSANQDWAKTDASYYATQAEADAALASATALELDANGDCKITTAGTYKLSGVLTIASGKTMEIAAGTVIIADGSDDVLDYIIIEKGATINAEGTSTDIIVMTSTKMTNGGWGGLHICGDAKINVSGGTGTSEIGDKTYGGSNDHDNSGTLKYIRLEFGGYTLSTTKEANGFTFYGVGDGTTVEYLHAYMGSDDGYEWFGGCVKASNLISTDNWDDSFDWTYGFTGELTNIYAIQISESCDCLIEGDNNSSDYTASPISCPIIENAVLAGKDSSGKRGVRIRRGCRISLTNANVTGKTNSFDIISEESASYFISTQGAFSSVLASGDLEVSDGGLLE